MFYCLIDHQLFVFLHLLLQAIHLNFSKPYSDSTAQIIDKEISNIVETQFKRAISLLKKHKNKLTELANYLLEKEVIFKEDLVRIFGERPFQELKVKK